MNHISLVAKTFANDKASSNVVSGSRTLCGLRMQPIEAAAYAADAVSFRSIYMDNAFSPDGANPLYFYELAHPTAGLRGDQRHALMVREFAAYEARFSATMRPIEAAAYKGDVKKFRAIYMDSSYDARDANPLYFYELAHSTSGLLDTEPHAAMVREFAAYEKHLGKSPLDRLFAAIFH